MEYCRYILSQSNNGIVKGFFDLDEKNPIEDFQEKLDEITELYKSNFRIKDKDFSYEEMLIKTIDKFFQRDILFGKKNEIDDVVEKLYIQTQKMFEIEKNNLKNKKPVSYDSMFEIITNFCILCSNTLQNENYGEKEKIIIGFKTMDIDPVGVRNMIGVFTNIFDKKKKAEEIAIKHKKDLGGLGGVGIASVPLMFLRRRLAFVPYVGPILVSALGAKIIWEEIYKDITNKDHSLFLYLWCVIAATYTRNEELKGMIDYGW